MNLKPEDFLKTILTAVRFLKKKSEHLYLFIIYYFGEISDPPPPSVLQTQYQDKAKSKLLCGPSRDNELLSNPEILMYPAGLMALINRRFLMPLAALTFPILLTCYL